MGSKLKPGKFDCYANAEPDEPMFILLARDPRAPDAVLRWIECSEDLIRRGEKPSSDRAMLDEARECAAAMIDWRVKNWPKPQ
jgi:hypothetical protein